MALLEITLANNFQPTKQELESLAAEAFAHDKQALELERQSTIICLQAAYLRDLAARKRSLNAPIRKLPPEVLGLVFVMCRDMEMAADDEDQEEGEELFHIGRGNSPILQTQVCRHWRNVAESNPSLWTQLHVMKDTLRLRHYEPLILRFVQLSRSLPLHLLVLDVTKGERVSPLFHASTWAAIFARCQTVILWIPPKHIQSIFPPNSRTYMPLLEVFRTVAYDGFGVIDAPLLKRYDIRNGKTPVLEPTALIPSSLSSLTKLQIYDASINAADAAASVLAFPNLTDCLFNNVHWTGPLPTAPFVAPNLQSLSIRWKLGSERYIPSLIHRVDLPSLRTLHLSATDDRSIISLPEEMMTSDGWNTIIKNLTALKLQHILIAGCKFWATVLPRFQDLETFEFVDCWINEDMISTLGNRFENSGEFRFCPKLSKLAVTMESWSQPLVDMIVSRVEHGVLRDGTFHGSPELSEMCYNDLVDLVELYEGVLSMPQWD